MPKIPAALEISVDDLADAIGVPGDRWFGRCHEISLAIVKARIFEDARVARGTARSVPGQHSWIALGDPYDERTRLVDPTLWTYDPFVNGVWYGTLRDGRHLPHGFGSIFTWGMPVSGDGEPVKLAPRAPLSQHASMFLRIIGPLDRRGWATLASHAPVGGWPAAEIIAAMDDTPELSALVPIDRLGMLTDRNPGGMYLPGEES